MRFSVWISALLLLSASFGVRAESFVVENIEVTGIKKITIGTVFNYLPINVGEELNLDRTPEIIRELYSTGFFDDIELLRRNNDLVIRVGFVNRLPPALPMSKPGCGARGSTHDASDLPAG